MSFSLRWLEQHRERQLELIRLTHELNVRVRRIALLEDRLEAMRLQLELQQSIDTPKALRERNTFLLERVKHYQTKAIEAELRLAAHKGFLDWTEGPQQ